MIKVSVSVWSSGFLLHAQMVTNLFPIGYLRKMDKFVKKWSEPSTFHESVGKRQDCTMTVI